MDSSFARLLAWYGGLRLSLIELESVTNSMSSTVVPINDLGQASYVSEQVRLALATKVGVDVARAVNMRPEQAISIFQRAGSLN
ncbi:hypothetical protein F7U66_00805 [Vibrio parahaemolyticus]|nr:hypothetical protein [Vibrio parahaemolyticus]